MDACSSQLSVAAGVLAGSLAFFPMLVASLSIMIGIYEEKRGKVADEALKKYRTTAWALISMGLLGIATCLLSLLCMLGLAHLFSVVLVLFSILVLCQMFVLLKIGLLFRG